jgi:uncharacterized membrane protein YfhO
VTAGQRPVFLDGTNALLAVFQPGFDGREIVVLPSESKPLVTVTNQTLARITHEQFGREQLDLDVEAESASLVVLAQTFYHCWRAFVDDQPVPLLRANYAFQALEVPAGKHRVRLAYLDRAFRMGVGVSAVALVICGAGLVLGRRGRNGTNGA